MGVYADQLYENHQYVSKIPSGFQNLSGLLSLFCMFK